MADLTSKRWFVSTTIIIFAVLEAVNEVAAHFAEVDPTATWAVRVMSIIGVIQRMRTTLPLSA